jgi:hypothetical protein
MHHCSKQVSSHVHEISGDGLGATRGWGPRMSRRRSVSSRSVGWSSGRACTGMRSAARSRALRWWNQPRACGRSCRGYQRRWSGTRSGGTTSRWAGKRRRALSRTTSRGTGAARVPSSSDTARWSPATPSTRTSSASPGRPRPDSRREIVDGATPTRSASSRWLRSARRLTRTTNRPTTSASDRSGGRSVLVMTGPCHRAPTAGRQGAARPADGVHRLDAGAGGSSSPDQAEPLAARPQPQGPAARWARRHRLRHCAL